MTATPQKVSFTSWRLSISGLLYTPPGSQPNTPLPAIIISHPFTGVKEQTSAVYASLLSDAGFLCLTFDAGYQGESTGEPRALESPAQRIEDCKNAVSFLATLPNVDAGRIGILGICASGGYVQAAAAADARMKAIATVSAACVGDMTRRGGVAAHLSEEDNTAALRTQLAYAGSARTALARGEPVSNAHILPESVDAAPEGTQEFMIDGVAYYKDAARGRHPRADNAVHPVTTDQFVTYDSFAFNYLLSPRPLLCVAGDRAQTHHYSETAVKKATGEGYREVFTTKGQNHFDLYDDATQSGPKLIEFFKRFLAEAEKQ